MGLLKRVFWVFKRLSMEELCLKYFPEIISGGAESFAGYFVRLSEEDMYDELVNFHNIPEEDALAFVDESKPHRKRYQQTQKERERISKFVTNVNRHYR